MCLFWLQNSLSSGLLWQILASAGTFLAVGATYLTVREMKKGREQTLTPHIIIKEPNERYQFRWVPLENLQPIISPLLPEGNQTQSQTRLPIFQLINIGQGPATDIRIDWKFTESTLEKMVEESTILKKYECILNENALSISRKDNGSSVTYSSNISDAAQSIVDYCLPSSTNHSLQKIQIPSDIESRYELRLLTLPRPNDLTVIKLENIYLLVTYSSIDGRTHTQSFVVESSILFLPDLVGSSQNSVNNVHFSSDNIRGDITFKVKKII